MKTAKSPAKAPPNVLSSSALRCVLRAEEHWVQVSPYVAGAHISTLTLVEIAAALGLTDEALRATQVGIAQIGISVEAFNEQDAYLCGMLLRKAPTVVPMERVAAIALAHRIDGIAVFVGEEARGVDNLSDRVCVIA